MPSKKTAALIAALGINFALAGGALMLANMNQPATYDADAAFADAYSDIQAVAGKPVDAEAGDLVVPLKAAQEGGNTRVTFTCGKDMGAAGREVHEGTWDQIAGAVLYRPDDQKLIAIEAVFDTRSLRTDANGLTQTVTVKEKWFDIDNHPTATFTCDQVKLADAATPSYTHDLIGQFTLNGITKPLTIPAKLDFSGQSVTIQADFTILRSDYDVKKRGSSIAGSVGGMVSKVDDEVKMSVRVAASPDPVAVISELAQKVELQQEELRIAGEERKRLMSLIRKVEVLEETTEQLKVSALSAQVQMDTTDLPQTFTDHAVSYGGKVPFGMVLVPGDAAKGIAPFYMSKHEVRWGMIDMWMYSFDLEQEGHDQTYIKKLIDQDIRPSPLFEEPAQLVQVKNKENPAMAMSLRNAKAYCKWLSEKTGRRYRLPTKDEWQHAMRLGGGVPDDFDAAVWHLDNAAFDTFGATITSPVGSKRPNALGIHDMFGSVAEWVTGTGEDRVIVGGSFLTPPDEITEDWQMIEDIEVWSANYPQLPKSRFWYSDVYYTGIRLICEPASVAANPLKPVE